MKRPHVVHIIPTLNIGGAERFVVSLCQHIDAKDVRQSVITLWDRAPLASELGEGVAHYSFGMDKISKWKRVQELSALLTNIEADVVHTHLFSADLWGRLAARRAGLPVVTTEHNINTAEPWHWRLIKRLMRRYSMRYTAPSPAVAEYLTSAYAVDIARIQTIPHGIDTLPFAALPNPRYEAPYTILLIGRLVEQKGNEVLLRALALLSDVPLTVHIVGSGELEHSLQELARELGVSHQITWKPAVQEVVEEYGAADMVVIPSLWEGFGLVALEAMASARVTIASDTGGLQDLITHGVTGFLVPPGDSVALAERLRSVIAAPPHKLQKIGTQARLWTLQHGDISAMADAYTEIYTDLAT